MLSKQQLLFLSALGGVLLFLGWPPVSLFIFLFIGITPFLLIEHIIAEKGYPNSNWKVLIFTYPGFVLWNALTTWWLFNASPAGAIFAILANALFMSVVFILYHITRSQLGNGAGYLSFFAYWITYEYLHHNWELAWTWLTLGNGLGAHPVLMQWYEYTGVFGGTFWILLANWLVFLMVRKFFSKNNSLATAPSSRKILVMLAGVLVLPAAISALQFESYTPKGKEIEVVVVQPNIDPYNEKFPDGKAFIPYARQIDRFLLLSAQQVSDSTAYLVWPETAIPGGMDVATINDYNQMKSIRAFMSQYPALRLVTGIDGYEVYGKTPQSPTSRLASDGITWFDAFNTAIQLDSSKVVQFYHKSKLVPGVERMPYPQVFRFLENLAIDMGGISGSLGTQSERSVFDGGAKKVVAPVICFESVFGAYLTGYIKNGATAIFVITNDGWWGNTAGYKQHLTFSSIRAIETRRSIARSANTGVSCFIDQKGVISQATPFWVQASIKGRVRLNDQLTFYVKHGNIIGRIALLTAILAMLITLISSWTDKFYFRRNK